MEERLASVSATGVTSVGSTAASGTCVLNPRPRVTPGSTTTFVATTEWLDSGTPVVSVRGDLDLGTAPTLEETLLALSGDGEGAVVVDLARCGFIDLRGLRVLLAARERLERLDRLLVLVVGNPSLLRVFEITRVRDSFAIYPSLAAAVESGANA